MNERIMYTIICTLALGHPDFSNRVLIRCAVGRHHFGVWFLRRSLPLIFSGMLSFFFFLMLFPGTELQGQPVDFIIKGDGKVSITLCTPGVLDFRLMNRAGDNYPLVGWHDGGEDGCVVMAVDAPEFGDLTVWMDAPAELTMVREASREQDVLPTLPFELRFAYANGGFSPTHMDLSEARAGAREVPAGICSVTFPVKQRLSGPPLPPPVPAYSGYRPTYARVYLFLYGTVQPASMQRDMPAGVYEGEIVVNIALLPVDYQ